MVNFFFSSRRRHTRYWRDWSSDVCSSDLRNCRLFIKSNSEPIKPCLNYHIKLCMAPCAGYVSKDEYGKIIKKIIDLLNGKEDRKSTRLNSSHANISYAVFCLKKKNLYVHPQDRDLVWMSGQCL